ncbi:MAG: LexA family protein [Thermoanaerobaculia bacterium]
MRKGRDSEHREAAIELAKAVHAAVADYNRRNPHHPFAIDDPASRILENDPDYHPPRKRTENKKRKPTANPGVFTVRRVAKRLGTTVGELLREAGHELTANDLRNFRWISDFLRMRFPIDELAAQTVPDHRTFIEKDFSFPRPLTTTKLEEKGELAAGLPLQSDFDVAEAEIIGETKPANLFAARVKGRSMHDRIRDGDLIVIDSGQTAPRQHDPVAVYIENEGGVLGYWRVDKGNYYLDKHNAPEFGPVLLGPPSDWRVLGLITLVQSRVSRQDRRTG